jgi:hypothetical protein
MITDRFGALLEELGKALKLTLKPDSHNACQIRYPDKMRLIMEPTISGDSINLVVEIANPGDGKYRESIFRAALQSNALPPPRNGIFCYSKKNDTLLLYDQISLDECTAPLLAEIIERLLQKARLWKESIGRSEVPVIFTGAASGLKPFGL